MNEWMEPFISQCLTDVPPGKYRTRTEKELRDHMETLRQFSSEQEVLQAMGDPERLRKEFFTAWKQTPLNRVNWMICGCIVIWGLMGLSLPLVYCLDFMGDLAWIVPLHLIPFPLGALVLHACFREERRCAWWVTLGLLIARASINLCLIWSGFAINELEGPDLMEQLVLTTPWLTTYLRLSFIGCLILGQFFGRNMKRRCETA